jgi:hypothetical protein
MDTVKASLQEFIQKNMVFLEQYTDMVSYQNIIIILLILYTSVVSMYTPRSIITLINQPLIKIIILGLILYVAKDDIILAIFIMIAFIVTISLDNSITVSKANLKPIIDYEAEGFVDYEEGDEPSTDIDVNNGLKKMLKSNRSIDENIKEEFEEDEEDDEDEEDETEPFVSNKNLNDTFKNLHEAIHKLENFIVSKKHN